MKRLFLLFCITGSLSTAYAQKGLLSKVSGGKKVTDQYMKLEAADRVSFSPTNAKSTLGLDANSDLHLLNSETDRLGQTHYRYFQTYQNIPVENSMIIAHTSGGKLEAVSGAAIVQFDSKMAQRSAASVSPAAAVAAAMGYMHATKYAWQDANFEQRIKMRKGAAASYYPVATKVWYGGDDKIDVSNLVLAYKVDIYTLQPVRDRRFIYIDAKTGSVLGSKAELMHTDATGTAATGYSGTQTIHSDLSGSSYRLRDLTKGNGIITLHASGSHADYTSSTANWTLTGADKWALDAHFGVAATWLFYKNNFNRNSVDNAGFALTSWVNDASNTDNADWDGSEMDYGNISSNGNGVTGIDVTGHELTHGVTQYTCNLTYAREPGAMNESMSDIMGKSVQFYTKPADNSWILSNDMGWEIRSFANPNADGQPDTYHGTNWQSTTPAPTQANDESGVHTNSGVGNFMYYLLVMGGSGTNDIGSVYTVNGIGLSEAQQILYRTETTYLTATSQYADWRTACINAATDLYGASSNEVIQVKNAWYAVGIGTAGGTGTPCTTPTGVTAGSITNTGATISWTAVAGSTGYTLQYKLSSASTFTTVTGITGTTYTLSGLTSGSAYQVQVANVCSAGSSSAYTTAVSFTTTGTAPISYCASVGGKVDGITNVTFGTINNTTSATTIGYTDYTAQSTSVNTGSAYTLSVKINTGGNYTNYTKAWIDWNHDGTFSTTTEEYNLGTAVNVTNGATTLSPLSITVPAGAVIGTTRMRVSTQYNANPSPCTASFDGEVEDYSVVVATGSGTTCNAPTGAAASAITSSSATLGWTAVSGATGYSVQYKLSAASTWTTVSAATNSYALSGLTASTAYQFQVATVCNATSTSAYSTAVSFTTSAAATCNAPTGAAASAITSSGATLGWTAVSGATGYSVQYKLSSASTWTTVSASTNSYALTGLTAATAYQFQVATVCSATSTSAYSSPVSFTTSSATVTYCTSSGTTTYEYLKTTVLGTINHTVASDGGYGNYTSLSTNLTAGTAYTISITPGFASSSYTEYYTVYIDYNHDGTLNGTGETVATGSGTGTAAKTLTFTVPTTSKNGATRLRVQMHYGSASTNPCGVLDFGDVHDYTVNISGGTGFNGAQGIAITKADAPAEARLMSVYPNPTNGTNATVKYSVPANGKVTVAIVDISGRTMQTEVIGNQNRGSYTYSLRRAGQLLNGSYFVVLSQDNVVIGRDKLVVSK